MKNCPGGVARTSCDGSETSIILSATPRFGASMRLVTGERGCCGGVGGRSDALAGSGWWIAPCVSALGSGGERGGHFGSWCRDFGSWNWGDCVIGDLNPLTVKQVFSKSVWKVGVLHG